MRSFGKRLNQLNWQSHSRAADLKKIVAVTVGREGALLFLPLSNTRELQ